MCLILSEYVFPAGNRPLDVILRQKAACAAKIGVMCEKSDIETHKPFNFAWYLFAPFHDANRAPCA